MLRTRKAFSLIELVIVVVIIGIIAAIAIPRFSNASVSAGDSALKGDLNVMRKAIDTFTTEHGGTLPTLANIVSDLTLYSDSTGTSCQTTQDSTHIYGPYLRSVPALSVGARKGNTGIGAADGPTIGWIYDAVAGNITANTTTEADASGTLYNTY